MQEINYRRFFDINDLIGLRMEYEPLFRAAHAKLIELAEKGKIDGVRLDHIDGLLDPQQYLLQFRAATAKSAQTDVLGGRENFGAAGMAEPGMAGGRRNRL